MNRQSTVAQRAVEWTRVGDHSLYSTGHGQIKIKNIFIDTSFCMIPHSLMRSSAQLSFKSDWSSYGLWVKDTKGVFQFLVIPELCKQDEATLIIALARNVFRNMFQ